MEALSTAHADYHALPLHPTVSFQPRLKYSPGLEDRDFTSQTHAAYTKKTLEVCEVAKHGGEGTRRDGTGHLYFTGGKGGVVGTGAGAGVAGIGAGKEGKKVVVVEG
ncbi:hypothetical protein HDU93_001594 [Gonapodya sp. JEL0774]|nr:hypothetical protein HDU93_001594 [Gonapodya sp. JEL0774]